MKQINLIYASLGLLKENFDVLSEKLPEKRREKFKSIKNEDAKLNFLGGALLLDIAAKRFGTDSNDVRYTDKGKPYIENTDFKFSVSHSDVFACCSFGNIASGCDIQVKRSMNLKVAKRFFSDKEYNLLMSSSDAESEFFKTWCRKESAYKLTGENMCTVENKQRIVFKDFKVFDNVFMCTCGFEDCYFNIEEIKFQEM